jgi:glycosyltransferase involved in cell wall biosynthesis
MHASTDLGPRSIDDDQVTVVIPAYNAENTIDETLRSARSQTHRNIEIIVVDDGSMDQTAAIVARHAREDRRVRLIQQVNGGVARARNHGIREARGGLIAPLDSDDLWAPSKIKEQLGALREAGDEVALVYTLFAAIDETGRIVYHQSGSGFEGRVMAELCDSNFIGNGSSVLMRRSAVLAAGGYDSRLRDMRAEGCEDYLLYFRIAERYEFRCVPEYLTGYRESAVSMSSDGVQMIKSFREVEREITSRHVDLAPRVRALRAKMAVWLLHRSVQAHNWSGVGYLALQITAVEPTWAPIAIYRWAKAKAKRALAPVLKVPAKPTSPTMRFEIGSPVADPPI